MEFSPEIAVLNSALVLASAEGKEEERKPCSKFIKIIGPAVHDIVNGLDKPRQDIDQEFWGLKVFSILFKRVLQSKEVSSSPATAESHVNPSCSLDLICQQLPPLRLTAFMEIVKMENWFQLLTEALSVLDTDTSLKFISSIMDHATYQSVDSLDGHLVLVALECVVSRWISLWIQDNREHSDHSREHSVFQAQMSAIETLLNKIFLFLTTNTSSDLELLITVLNQLMLSAILSSPLEDARQNINALLNNAIRAEETTNRKHCVTFKTFCSWFKNRNRESEEVSIQPLTFNFPFSAWMETLNIVCVTVKDTLSRSSLRPHLQDTIMFASDKIFVFTVESLALNFFTLFQDEKYLALLSEAGLIGLKVDVDVIILITQQILCDNEAVIEEMSKQENQSISFDAEDILEHRLPSCDEVLKSILMDVDLKWWSKQNVCENLLLNLDLFCEVDHIKQMKNIIQQGLQNHPEKTEALNNVKTILLAVFSELPVIIQEKLIVDSYLEGPDSRSLASVGTFEKDVTVIFNKFTSDSLDKQLLNAVLCLALQDPLYVLKKVVETAVRNGGQIPVVLEILHSLPDLCRSFHPVLHSDHSLLTNILNTCLTSEILKEKEQKNVIQFIVSAVQKFERQFGINILHELPILEPAEFISRTVLPFIGVDGIYKSDQPMSVDFALHILTAVIDNLGSEKSSHLLEVLNPCPLILCLCNLLHECVLLTRDPEHFVTKVTVKEVCNRCWSSLVMLLKTEQVVIDDYEITWLLNEVKQLDWTVLLRLHIALSNLHGQTDINVFHDVTRHLISDGNYVSLLRLISQSEESLKPVTSERSVTAEEIVVSLLQVLPSVTVEEAKRICFYIKNMLSTSTSEFQFKLFFQDCIHLCDFEVLKGTLQLSQILMEVFVLVVEIPEDVSQFALRHMLTCYVAVMKSLTEENFLEYDHHVATFTLTQIFCHISIITTLLTSDLSEALFVLLLDILAKFTELMDRLTSSKKITDDIHILWEPIFKAVNRIENEDMRESLMKKTQEHYVKS